MFRNLRGLFLSVSGIVGERCIASLRDKKIFQVAYMAYGSVRFDSVGIETVRGYFLAFLEHSWRVATAGKG